MKFKKLFIMFFVGILFIAGCSKNEVTKNNNKKTIYTTFFPIEYLTNQIVKDKMEVKTIIEGGEEAHDFELKAKDIVKISKSDLIIFNGANLENFIPSLKDVVKNDDKFLDLSAGLTLLQYKDGEGEHHHHHHHDDEKHNDHHDDEKHDDHHEHNDQKIVNPHTWLSVKNAIMMSETIYKKIISIDPENQEFYKNNLDSLVMELKKLDVYATNEFKKLPDDKRYFIVSHAAFNYLANDYNLKQVSVTGISQEDEPSANTLVKLSEFVKEHNIKTIFFEGSATPKVAKTLANEVGIDTATIYTMETLSDDEAKLGYVELMKKNIESLVKGMAK